MPMSYYAYFAAKMIKVSSDIQQIACYSFYLLPLSNSNMLRRTMHVPWLSPASSARLHLILLCALVVSLGIIDIPRQWQNTSLSKLKNWYNILNCWYVSFRHYHLRPQRDQARKRSTAPARHNNVACWWYLPWEVRCTCYRSDSERANFPPKSYRVPAWASNELPYLHPLTCSQNTTHMIEVIQR